MTLVVRTWRTRPQPRTIALVAAAVALAVTVTIVAIVGSDPEPCPAGQSPADGSCQPVAAVSPTPTATATPVSIPSPASTRAEPTFPVITWPSGPGASQDATAANAFGWVLLHADEFNYQGAPDRDLWFNAPQQCMAGHDGNGRRCGANATVVDGVLRLRGMASGDTAWIASNSDRQYGRWELRVRSISADPSADRQYHPVLLIWPDSERWPEDGEYDFLETSRPGADCAAARMHYPHVPGRVQTQDATRCGVDLAQWHNIAFEWTPDHVAGYLDGEEWYRFSGGADETRECIQCMPSGHLTIQLDNFFGGDMTPAVFEVDWYREYR